MGSIFYAIDRKGAVARTHVPETREYIERLEKVARAAYELWKVTPHANNPLVASSANDLYDALAAVNFMAEVE